MKNLTFLFLLVSVTAFGATPVNVQKQSGTNRLTADLKVPTGKTVTVESGGTLDVTAGTVTGLSAAPIGAKYIVQTADGTLTNEQALSSLSTGLMQVTTTTGVITSITNSSGVSAMISDETGSGLMVFATSPAFSTDIGLPTGSSVTTSTAGRIAFDTDAHAASRGAIQVYDGTANTFLVGVLASDTPTNGQVPTWNTGGTITWETGGGGGGSIGGSTGSTDNALIRADGTGGATVQSSNVTLADSGTALVFSGAAGLSASGTNQNVTLTPTGTGVTSIVGAATATGVVSGSGIAVTGSAPKIRYDYISTSFADALVIQPTTTNKDGRIVLAPTGSVTESVLLLQSNPSVDTTNSEVFGLGGGFSGSVSGSWNFGSFVYANTTGNSRPISFTVSNSTDGRIESVRMLNTGSVAVKRSIASSSTTTGALTVSGGVGIAGATYIGGILNIATSTPASAAASGVAGTIAWDSSYIYICTATNTWKRVAIATW